MFVLEGAEKKVTSLRFSQDQQVLFSAESNATTTAWELGSQKRLWQYRIGNGDSLGDLGGLSLPIELALHPSSGAVYVSAWNFGFHRIDPKTGQGETLSEGKQAFTSGCESTEEGVLEIAWQSPSPHATLRLWKETAHGASVAEAKPLRSNGWQWPFCVQGDYYFSCLDNGLEKIAIHKIDLRDHLTFRIYPSPNIQLGRLTVAGSNLYAISGASLIRWELESAGKPAKKVTSGNRKHFTDLAVHPTNGFVYATANDHTVRVYDPNTMKLVSTIEWQIGRMRSIALTPDGALAAAGSDSGDIIVWDVDL